MIDKGYGIMPNNILFDKNLSDKQKLLYCYISSLCAEKGYCWASNKYIGQKLGVNETTISTHINILGKLGYIEIQEGSNQKRKCLLKNQNTPFEKSKAEPFEKSKDNNIIYNNINNNNINNNINNTKSEDFEKNKNDIEEYGKPEINLLIKKIKDYCLENGISYDKEKERMFAKHICTAKDYGEFCVNIGQDRITFALNVLKASIKINYWKGVCSGPMKIYQNYSDVYNKTLLEGKKKQEKSRVAFIPSIYPDD